jgi:hypothetical protein
MQRIARWIANVLETRIWIGLVAEGDPIQDWSAESPRPRTVAECVLAAQGARHPRARSSLNSWRGYAHPFPLVPEGVKPGIGPSDAASASKAGKSWLFRASHRKLASIAATVALLIFSVGEWLDRLAMNKVLPFHTMAAGDAAVAVLTGLLLFKVLADARRHHHELLRQMETIRDMNHHIRNALQVIAYHNVSHSSSEQAVEHVGEAVERIEWALREVLPEWRLADEDGLSHQPERRRAHSMQFRLPWSWDSESSRSA